MSIHGAGDLCFLRKPTGVPHVSTSQMCRASHRRKILAADSSTAPHEDWASNGSQHTYIPPTGRSLKTGKAFHSQCCPVSEAS